MKKKRMFFYGRETTIYYMENEDVDMDVLQRLLRQSGIELKKIQDLSGMLDLIENLNKKEKTEETGVHETIHLLHSNIPPSLRTAFRDLQSILKPFSAILQRLNIGFCIFTQSKYLLYNDILGNILQYGHAEIENLMVGGTVMERERKKLREETRNLVRNKQSYVEMQARLATESETIRNFQLFGFQIIIENRVFGAGYILDREQHHLTDPTSFSMHKMIVAELQHILYNLATINNTNLNPRHLQEAMKMLKHEPVDNLWYITKRELEVLQLIYQGLSNQKIAEKLFISKRTVEFHRSNLLDKTQSNNSIDLIRFAIRNRLISV
jgi:DNA-binding CsgD family transcriptional regulator